MYHRNSDDHEMQYNWSLSNFFENSYQLTTSLVSLSNRVNKTKVKTRIQSVAVNVNRSECSQHFIAQNFLFHNFWKWIHKQTKPTHHQQLLSGPTWAVFWVFSLISSDQSTVEFLVVFWDSSIENELINHRRCSHRNPLVLLFK